MKKEKPVELRKVLIIVESLKELGIGFIPIPYTTEKEKKDLLRVLEIQMGKLEKIAD